MPSCRPEVISDVLYKVLDLKPKTVLDVGVCHGKWGVLCDEYLRHWCGIVPIIDGVEVFEAYESRAWNTYRKIYLGNVMDFLEVVPNYDLVLIIDVIEHLSREDGLKLLSTIKGHYIVSTPNYWNPQPAVGGNEHERHVSQWAASDFANSQIIKGRRQEFIMGWR